MGALAERQFTTFLTDVGPTDLDGHAAWAATVEIAEVTKVEQAPDHRDSKVRIVFANFAVLDPPKRREPWPLVSYGGRLRAMKVKLAMLGYRNTADHFDNHLDEFEAFRRQIRLLKAHRLDGTHEPAPEEGPETTPAEDHTEVTHPAPKEEAAAAPGEADGYPTDAGRPDGVAEIEPKRDAGSPPDEMQGGQP